MAPKRRTKAVSDNNYDGTCERCGCYYDLRDGQEPTPLCDECAQIEVARFRKALKRERMVGPHERTIKRRLKELRAQIDTSKDPAVQRISYAMECGIIWAREKTVGWEAPAVTARDLAVMLHRELKE